MPVFVAKMELELRMPWCHSLKEKRMVVRSLLERLRGRFEVAVAEVDMQDVHQRAVVGVACVSGNPAQAIAVLDKVLEYAHSHCEAEITLVERAVE